MHIRPAATAAAILLLALTACTSSDPTPAAPKPKPTPSVASSAPAGTGIPPEPTGQARADYLAALRAISPKLVADEDDAIDNGRNQCSGIRSERPVWTAQQRFSTSDHQVSEAEAERINEAVKTHICN